MLRRYRQVVCDHIGQALSWSDQDFVVIIVELHTHSLKNSWESYSFFPPRIPHFVNQISQLALGYNLIKTSRPPYIFAWSHL